jgi:hypothetical protein
MLSSIGLVAAHGINIYFMVEPCPL